MQPQTRANIDTMLRCIKTLTTLSSGSVNAGTKSRKKNNKRPVMTNNPRKHVSHVFFRIVSSELTINEYSRGAPHNNAIELRRYLGGGGVCVRVNWCRAPHHRQPTNCSPQQQRYADLGNCRRTNCRARQNKRSLSSRIISLGAEGKLRESARNTSPFGIQQHLA